MERASVMKATKRAEDSAGGTSLVPNNAPSSRQLLFGNSKKFQQQTRIIKLSRRNALWVACIIYFFGTFTGLFLCSVVQVEKEEQIKTGNMLMPKPRQPTSRVSMKSNVLTPQPAVEAATIVDTGNHHSQPEQEQQQPIRAAKRINPNTLYNSNNSNNKNATNTETGKNKKKKRNAKRGTTPIIHNHNRTNNTRYIQYPANRPLLPSELKLPTPILVMGMMKAGTTSIYGYFQCGMDANTSRLSHYDCRPPSEPELQFLEAAAAAGTIEENNTTTERIPSSIGLACGRRLRRNVEHYQYDAFKTINDWHLYAELDAQENNGGITLPQWSFLQAIHDQFPEATWILNIRDNGWLQSINRWKDLRQRLIDFHGGADFPKGSGTTDQEMMDFYHLQAQRVRDFVALHPSHTLVEVHIDDSNAGQVLEDAFGISSQKCWRSRNVYNGTAKWTAH